MLHSNQKKFPDSNYIFRHNTNHIVFLSKPTDTLLLFYRIYPLPFRKNLSVLDSVNLYATPRPFNPSTHFFKNDNVIRPGDPYFLQNTDGLQKNGSISRGISIGNNQNSSLQSQLNLQVFGKLTEDIEIEMAATDNSIPFQPDGTTAQLQEFDRVYITAKTPFVKLTAGDFQSRNAENFHFLKYFKRLQGLQAENLYADSSENWQLFSKLSFAVSKGKFSRQVFFGRENNQGPYRLRGANNELFIIVLSGTERIYVDGILMERGQDRDYIIDYNSAEIRFTARMPITKDKRIVAEFQYAERNYARSLLEWQEELRFKKAAVFFGFLNEQDNPNRPLQQTLTPEQKLLLFNIGDSLNKAVTSSAFKTEFNPDEILYVKKDTLHQSILYTNIFQYKNTKGPTDTFYKVTFSQVGVGKGNYIRDPSVANGRVFRWVAPLNGQPQGDYEPVILLVTPKRNSLLNAGFTYTLNRNHQLDIQGALSENNLNRFSPYNKSDNRGYAASAVWNAQLWSNEEKNKAWFSQIKSEYLSKYFVPFERFRTVEFDRDWNRPLDGRIRNEQFFGMSKIGYQFGKFSEISGQAEYFNEAGYYEGKRYGANLQIGNRLLWLNHQNRYLESRDTLRKNFFYRHRTDAGVQLTRKIKAGYKDRFEQNIFSVPALLASPGMANSYRFHEWEPFVEIKDSSTGHLRLFYRERLDKALQPIVSDSVRSIQTGGECRIFRWPNHPLFISVQYRELSNKNKNLFRIPDQRGFFNRMEYQPSFFKKSVTAGLFAESGYGLENRQEFYYLEVTPGQGQYAWIDYNGDGIKQLNEFEPARFPDQARFIRVFVPTNDYFKVLKNQLDFNLNLRPSAAIKPAGRWSTFIRRWQWQAIYRGVLNYAETDRPFPTFNFRSISDTLLQAANSRLRLSTFLNSGSPVFGAEHHYQKNNNVRQINFGIDRVYEENHELKLRYTIKRKYTFFIEGRSGIKNNTSLLFPVRNYFILFREAEMKFSYQPGTEFRITASGKYTEKINRIDHPDMLFASEYSLELRYNLPQNGSIQSRISFIQNRFNGNANSAAGFEMLNALTPGQNWVWEAGWQQNISKNLQANVYYQGRKNIRWIHTGNFEIRAFF